jgi:hypothetical protein
MEASPPKILPGALASLLKLAQTADLYLITQLPHSGCKELTEYFEQHTVTSELSPHGVWQDDKMELAVRKVPLTTYRASTHPKPIRLETHQNTPKPKTPKNRRKIRNLLTTKHRPFCSEPLARH